MGMSPMHLIIILVIVLVLFGPSRLPGLGRGLGDAIRGFKKGLEGDEIDVTPKQVKDQRNEQLHASDPTTEINQTDRTKNHQDS